TIRCKQPVSMALRLRVPYWATKGGTLRINGRALETFADPSSYLVINRTWKDGDTVEMIIPMEIHVHPMPDDPTIQAFLYGPLVLAGRLGTQDLTPSDFRAVPTKPRTVPEYTKEPIAVPDLKNISIQRDSSNPLAFMLTGQSEKFHLAPFYQVIDERYAVYWKVT